MKALVIHTNKGRVKEIKRVSTDDLVELVKSLAIRALKGWDANSDFVVMKDTYTIILEIPLRGEEFDELRKYNLRRKGSLAVADIPVYGISCKNRWTDKGVEILELILVAPSVSDRVDGELIEYAKEMTKLD